MNMRAKNRSVLVGLLLLAAIGRGVADDCIEYADYMHWVEAFDYQVRPRDLKVVGDRLYILDPHQDVRILSLVDGRPTAVLGTVPSGNSTYGMDVVDDILFLANNYDGLVIYNVEDLYSPDQIAMVPISTASSVCVDGGIAYVCSAVYGFTVVDVSDPYHPQVRSVVPLGRLARLAVCGTVVYAANYNNQMTIVDCSAPGEPVVVGTRPIPTSVTGMKVKDSLLYVLGQPNGPDIFALADPLQPVLLTHITLPHHCFGIDIVDGAACVAIQGRGVAVIDVRNPANISLIGTIDARGPTEAVAIAGSYALLGAENQGIDVVDISGMAIAPELDHITMPANPRAVVTREGLAYVANYTHGLTVVDVRDPRQLSFVGNTHTRGRAEAVAVSGDVAWLASWESGLQAVDVSDPAHPSYLGGIEVSDFAVDVVAMDDVVIVSARNDGLCIVDGHDPANLAIITYQELASPVAGLELIGTRLFVANEGSGLEILDVSNPAVPVRFGGLDYPGWNIHDVAVSEDLAILADGSGYVHVVDVSNPTWPTLVGSVRVLEHPWRISARGHLAAVDAWSTKLVDFENPGEPRIIGGFQELADPTVTADCILGVTSSDDGNLLCALPLPCGGPVAVQVWGFTAACTAEAVHLAWFHALSQDTEFRVRGEHDDQPTVSWTVTGYPDAAGEGHADDASAAARRPGTVRYRLECRPAGQAWQVIAETSIVVPPMDIPTLASARPNPFNPRTEVRFTLPAAVGAVLAVYDTRGQLVDTLVDDVLPAGEHVGVWDGQDARGGAMPSGTYFCLLTTAWGTQSTKMVLVR
jgi:hypothetical protein